MYISYGINRNKRGLDLHYYRMRFKIFTLITRAADSLSTCRLVKNEYRLLSGEK